METSDIRAGEEGERKMGMEYQERRPGRETGLDAAAVFRGIAGVLGVMIIFVGLGLGIKTFFSIRDLIKNPAGFQESVKKWAEVMGSEEAKIEFKDTKAMVPLAHILTLVGTCAAYFLMSWLSVAIMGAGGRIVVAAGGRKPTQPSQS
jgi:hypothetical protein